MALLPDFLALCVLLLILYYLRRRHAGDDVHLWFAGLLLLLGESIAHMLFSYDLPAWMHRSSHIAALDCYALAGAVFVYAALHRSLPGRRLAYALLAITVVRIAALSLYGLDVRTPRPYYVVGGAGLAVAVTNMVLLGCRNRAMLVLANTALWAVFCLSVARSSYRFAAYWLLCCLFAQAAVYFARHLPRRSIGKYTVVSGFAVWALLFLTHSNIPPHTRFFDLAEGLWNLQKFQIAVGMLIVLLETQVERTKELALHDPLTNLPNRRLLDDRLTQAMLQAARTHTRVAFLMLDLDGFKEVNDRHGHEAGDHVLCAISKGLGLVLRSSDTLARLGGDEFAIVASGFTTAQPLTGEVLRAVSVPIRCGDRMISMSGSLGYAVYPDDTTDPVRLRQLADERMYMQKREHERLRGTKPSSAAGFPASGDGREMIALN